MSETSKKPMSKQLDAETNKKLDVVVPKLVRLLGMVTSNADGEVITATHALLQVLTNAGLDIHVLVSRIEHGKADDEKEKEEKKLSAGQMQKIHEAAYAKGYAEGIEAGRRSAVIAAAMPMGIIDTSDVGPGVNGYGWLAIAQHCAANKHLFSGKAVNFVEDIPGKIASFGRPTPPQAKWLKDLFMQKFGGRID
jgi:hypothetical protein